MDRSVVVSMINKLKGLDEISQGRLDEFQEYLASVQTSRDGHRQAWADDWHRAIVYCFVLFTRVGYLDKERRRFLRPTKRSVLLTVLLILAVVFEIVFLAVVFRNVDSIYVLPLIILILLFQLGYIVSKISKYESGSAAHQTESGFSLSCVGCESSLDGLESVLGDQLWVGPAVCPECGQEYPAISE